MDFAKEFEEYLPQWSNEKHLPIPTKQHMGKWYEAWNDFVKEKLVPRWETIKEEYKNLQLKERVPGIITQAYEEETEEEEPVEKEQPLEQEKELSEWEKVQKYLK